MHSAAFPIVDLATTEKKKNSHLITQWLAMTIDQRVEISVSVVFQKIPPQIGGKFEPAGNQDLS